MAADAPKPLLGEAPPAHYDKLQRLPIGMCCCAHHSDSHAGQAQTCQVDGCDCDAFCLDRTRPPDFRLTARLSEGRGTLPGRIFEVAGTFEEVRLAYLGSYHRIERIRLLVPDGDVTPCPQIPWRSMQIPADWFASVVTKTPEGGTPP